VNLLKYYSHNRLMCECVIYWL